MLLLVQAAIFTMSLLESMIASIAFPNPLGVGSTAVVVVALLLLVRSAGRGRARRALVWFERSLLLWFVVDSALSLTLAQRPLELVPTLTRFVLPLVILRLVKGLQP